MTNGCSRSFFRKMYTGNQRVHTDNQFLSGRHIEDGRIVSDTGYHIFALY